MDIGAEPSQTIVVKLPEWVPVAARNYLVHTETGVPIRALARANACHASTILRQVRRFENRRDDPLVDDILRDLSRHVPRSSQQSRTDTAPMQIEVRSQPTVSVDTLTEAQIEKGALRVLRRLCEQGAVLASARDMTLAVVVRDTPDGVSTRTATVEKEIAQAMALREWINCADAGARIARYHITSLGRAALKRLLAASENRAQGLGDWADQGDGAREWSQRSGDPEDARPLRYNLSESPLAGLARRKDRDGKPFLTRDMVTAGERLREDFELAQMGPKVAQNWERYLTGPLPSRGSKGSEGGSEAARNRVMAALHDLGPGLGDVVLRCCCFLEGLEVAEKRMGWAARSGKIVLRIALLRLRQHYDATQGKYGPKIG
jgi:hypothetical protein